MDGHFLVIAQIDSRSSREKSSGFVKRYLNVRVSSILCTQFVHNMKEAKVGAYGGNVCMSQELIAPKISFFLLSWSCRVRAAEEEIWNIKRQFGEL